ncbi:hypothetical protein L873DRAFT_1813062 [Choiromyces venosus 120613-1]|uniref:CCHC-type domain-containing protein n=1 Tax=Choiromyces venosus 120613-1 TaxID=1336337 RepID=A0A3N4JDK7_9PEZI|nr:hypothetical protein L873DRAFT_1813062 [Choiromyces venosus 120613-1]
MGYPRPPAITFAGDDMIGVRAFLSWMESWFATMGEEFSGDTPQAKRMRVAQIHVACPIRSAAGVFLRQLPDDILWNERKLKEAMIEQFDDTEADEQDQEDILSIMSGLEQGERDMFAYSQKVLKILRRKPAKVNQFDKILIRYYIEDLASQRLREMAIMSFRKPDSNETPYKVVKGVMRLVTQLKMKGYRKARSSDVTESSDEEESSGDDDSDSSSDSEDNKAYKYSKKSTRRSEKSEKRSGKRYQDKSEKKSRGREGDSIRDEVKELREMLKHLMESRKDSSTTTGTSVTHPDADVIPLDSYTVNRTYGNYPLQDRYGYEQFNQGYPTNRRPEFPNRRNQTRQLASADSDRAMGRVSFATSSPQERGRMRPATFDTFQNSYQTPQVRNPSMQPIVGPNSVLYHPARNTIICYNCGEEGHMRPHCPKLRSYGLHSTLAETERERIGPKRASDLLPPLPPPPLARGSDRAVSVVELATVSSAFDGVKVREVSVAEVDEKVLMRFIEKVPDGKDDEDDSDLSEVEAPVMAGERARCFSELPLEFDGEAGPASQRQRTDEVKEVISEARAVRQPVSRAKRKPICMMAGREKFDFVGAFRDTPVLGLNWGSFFDLAPTVKKDICRLLVQERAKGLERGKAKRHGKKVSSVATDQDLGDVANFYTRGVIKTKTGRYRIARILVDAGSVVNLMPIKVLRAIGAKMMRTNGMVIGTATNALARIAHCADLCITVAGVPCDLRVYALPAEYSPTYPMLLSRRWLQAVKAKGDYAGGRYYIMSGHGTRVQIPSDENYKGKVRETKRGCRPRVPIVLRDKEVSRGQLSAEVEEELELQETQGGRFFERLIQLIREEADEQMKEEEDDESDDGGISKDSEN